MHRAIRTGAIMLIVVTLSACQSFRPEDNPDPVTQPAQASTSAQTVQTGRYTAAITLPTEAQRDPLAAIVQIPRLPSDIRTIEQGMRYVLSRTGYSLALVDDKTDTSIRTLYSLPIPEVQRTLGPLTVRDCLGVFAGQAFEVRIDRVARVVFVSGREAST